MSIIAAEVGAMRIRVSNRGVADDLQAALQEADCVIARVGDDTVDVEFPWADDEAEARQARLELTFFVKAWQAQHPGLDAALVEA